jgi:tetratricopeptide (TPR) repeat protein
MRALVLSAQGRDAEAAYDFQHAVELETPGDPAEAARMRALWARFLTRRGELAGARALLDEALRVAPDHPLALAYRAELDLRTGKLAEARAGFDRAFARARQVRYLMDMARAQELAGDKAAATSTRAQVEKLVRADLADKNIGHKLDLVEVLVDRGAPSDLAEAVALAREELDHRPSADTRFQLARALYRSGARDEARVQIQAALSSGARDARMYELAARVEAGPRRALYAREAARLDPGGSGWRMLGMGT